MVEHKVSGTAADEASILSQITDRLIKAYHPERIYLFGSTARGDAGPDSDYDILMVVRDDASPEVQSPRLAYDVLWGLRAAADVHIMLQHTFNSRLRVKASLPATVAREGRLLYAA